ncbi:SRPBCC family protein [Actinomadura litoris]|uniref:Polyketide cyclase n=1 Tax=Actinomadura litoris TaxID=2678616 RepID=A0A7K1L073_9ACTN|nr:SRPBCC family protein [Actinomadura litoris]MUN37626.1 polyketide cyclase [Actinomadura litoris]
MNETTITARPGTPFIDTVREFDAPAGLVFRALTDPELIPRWLGSSTMTTEVVEYEVRPGGRYSYIHRGGGGEHRFHGVFHAVVADERIVQTFQYDGRPDEVSLETLTFANLGDRTRMHIHAVHGSVEARDAMIESGMEHGVRDSMARLEHLLAR